MAKQYGRLAELLSYLWVHQGPAVIHGHWFPALRNSAKLGSLFIGQNSFCIRARFFLDCCQLLDLVCGESQLILQCSNARRAVPPTLICHLLRMKSNPMKNEHTKIVSEKLPHLFSPLQLGEVKLAHRVVMATRID
jgi:hypothetical protein